MIRGPAVLPLSGERLVAVYDLTGDEATVAQRARAITYEQTVEFPADLLAAGAIADAVVGRVEALVRVGDARWEARISYALESAGAELTQLLNLLFGNISLQPGIRLVDLELPPGAAHAWGAPRFGIAGLRARLEVPGRALLCTALKPMGLSPVELAELAHLFARGGMDIIKDDHGLADQPFCRFEERLARCTAAVARANIETGSRALYAPNISGPAGEVLSRARLARQAGAGALLVAPGLVGFDAMRQIAADDTIALPIISHPAWLGSFVTADAQGIAHGVIFGLLQRLAGADASIFPNHGGRFAFGIDDCRRIAAGCRRGFAGLPPIFPVPAGGMSLARVPEMLQLYGRDVMLLIGGDLHRHGDLETTCRRFRAIIAPEAGQR